MIDSGYIDFEWDERKAKSNVVKHAVTFDEAVESFYDPYARIIDDPTTRTARSGSCSSA